MEQIALNYFQGLFSFEAKADPSHILRMVRYKVSQAEAMVMDRRYTAEEVLSALKQIHSSKAPGPDGMNASFFKHYWPIIGDDVTKAVLEFLNEGIMTKGVNRTHIVLIPKTKNPNAMKDFRPISLCNVIYKLISKILANRLKPLLPSIISKNQSAFVPGRLIYDNVMVAFEMVHHLKNKRQGTKGDMAIKLDLSKAFDRVEWDFLQGVMQNMGLPSSWIDRVMTCVRTVEYSILLNGSITREFTPSRGIRQGDPLSPFLFLFCAEGLYSLLENGLQSEDLKGATVCRVGPKISHLFFADDSLLFGAATEREATHLVHILQHYSAVSGQQINLDKSSIFFSCNTPNNVKTRVMEILNISQVLADDKYLGMPLLIGRNKSICFTSLRDRIWSKIKGWKNKLLSKAGQEVLIKAVV
ncbi:hypothetical protein SLA2020_079500 [Shorea laevis]